MKKILVAITFVLLLGLVACGGGKKPENGSKFYEYLNNTKEVYEESNSANVKFTLEIDGDVTELEYIYNLSNGVFTDLQLVLKEGDNIMAAYVTDGVAYMNVNGELTEEPFEDGDELLERFGLAVILDDAYKLFDLSLMTAFDVETDEDSVVELVWNSENYVFLDEDLVDDVEAWTAADERFRSIEENLAEITATITYEEEQVVSLNSSWVYNDDKVSTIKIEFNGTGTQTVEVPNDF